jgi:hypothetical protein
MLIAPQTETESLANPGPRALDQEMVGGERRSGRGRNGTERRETETRRGGVAGEVPGVTLENSDSLS